MVKIAIVGPEENKWIEEQKVEAKNEEHNYCNKLQIISTGPYLCILFFTGIRVFSILRVIFKSYFPYIIKQ